jgi:polyisoprenyl-teichoic acid--peptidoglycan teichoic acid transferase
MKKSVLILLFLLIILVVSFLLFQLNISGQLFNSDIHLLSGSDQSNQPTPFQPFIQTITPTAEGYVVQNALVPSAGYHAPSGQVNILLLGSDYRANQGSRTDIILLVSLFTKEKKINLISFPRDLFLEIPGFGQERINTTQALGGFPLTQATFEYNFGIHLDHYVMTNFNGFQAIIETLGGIDINAASNLTDRCDLPYSHGSYCSVGPGPHHLDGALALWYVRSRYSTSDFDRGRRAQEVAEGIFNKLISWNAISRAPELFNQFINAVETDMTITDVLPLIPLASSIASDSSQVKQFSIGLNQANPYIAPSTGAYLLMPDYNAIWQVILQAIYTP